MRHRCLFRPRLIQCPSLAAALPAAVVHLDLDAVRLCCVMRISGFSLVTGTVIPGQEQDFPPQALPRLPSTSGSFLGLTVMKSCDQTETIRGRELILTYSFRGMGVHHGSQQQEQELKVGILKCRGDSSGLLTRKDPSGCFYSS